MFLGLSWWITIQSVPPDKKNPTTPLPLQKTLQTLKDNSTLFNFPILHVCESLYISQWVHFCIQHRFATVWNSSQNGQSDKLQVLYDKCPIFIKHNGYFFQKYASWQIPFLPQFFTPRGPLLNSKLSTLHLDGLFLRSSSFSQ